MRVAPVVWAVLSLAIASTVAVGAARATAGDGAAEGGGKTEGERRLPPVVFRTAADATATLTVEVADDPIEQICGLMWRTEMPADHGMIFVFSYDYFGGFWNRNTLIPLSVAYIAADGAIVDIIDMEAIGPDEEPTTQQPDTSEDRPVRFVIEANRGWFAQQGIAIGDRVDVSAALLSADQAGPPPVAPC
jgi:uncharacterized membrane protein (UPF0127 family)